MYNQHTPIRRKLRRESTESEKLLWMLLRNKKLGYKFKRQYSIGSYIADFYCDELKLIIELDGYTHGFEETYYADKTKQTFLENLGYTVKRYSDEQVLSSTESVHTELTRLCEELAQ